MNAQDFSRKIIQYHLEEEEELSLSQINKILKMGEVWVAQLVERCPTVDFTSDHDLRIMRLSSALALCSAWSFFCLSAPLPSPPSHLLTHSPSLISK